MPIIEYDQLSIWSKYIGDISNDMRNGTGTLYFKNGDSCKAIWENNNCIKLIEYWSGTSCYENITSQLFIDIHANRNTINGYGKHFDSHNNDVKYYGYFKNGKFDGRGIIYTNMSKFIGEFTDGLKNGVGLVIYYTSIDQNTIDSELKGNWINGELDGEFIESNKNYMIKAHSSFRNSTKANGYFEIKWNDGKIIKINYNNGQFINSILKSKELMIYSTINEINNNTIDIKVKFLDGSYMYANIDFSNNSSYNKKIYDMTNPKINEIHKIVLKNGREIETKNNNFRFIKLDENRPLKNLIDDGSNIIIEFNDYYLNDKKYFPTYCDTFYQIFKNLYNSIDYRYNDIIIFTY
jgi:hypothetical protein